MNTHLSSRCDAALTAERVVPRRGRNPDGKSGCERQRADSRSQSHSLALVAATQARFPRSQSGSGVPPLSPTKSRDGFSTLVVQAKPGSADDCQRLIEDVAASASERAADFGSTRWRSWSHRKRCFSGGAILLAVFAVTVAAAQPVEPVRLNWLDGQPPATPQSVSWGVPWPKGRVQKSDSLVLKTAAGKTIPAQVWPMAYWPDGSIMWSGQSIVATPDIAGPLQLAVGAATDPTVKLACTQDDQGLTIDTGAIRVRVPKQGSSLVESISIGERKVAQDGKLICRLEDRSGLEATRTVREEEFISRIKTVTLEQSGPVRAVVKIEGDHKSTSSGRAWLPFVVRLYFNAGLDSIRVVHSFVFDSDGQKDFIKGLGLSFSVPLREEVINRHVRFGGDEGMWAEPVKPMVGRRIITDSNQSPVFPVQVAGRRVPKADQYVAVQQRYLGEIADWDDYKLTQANAHGFVIEKRTQAKSSWLHVTEGKRALGFAFLGDVSGGLAVGVKKFWQKNPSALEIHGATSPLGELRVWFWSPDVPAMDLRHYDIKGHGLDMAYEDWKEGWDSPLGVANTNELTLWACASVPGNADLVKMANAAAQPAVLVCTPQYYHDQRAFGFWSLPDRSGAVRRALEDQLETAFDFFRDQVDQHSWYGFWDYGDDGRMYDEIRHEWRYDIGGQAWNNTELLPDYWLWYSFLRTGRADCFRLAEAMTWHTSEVDVHHLGRFAPLGSRHNVNHWGDGAKQPRISQAGLKRFLFFLSTDERIGDLMREQLTADKTYADVKRTDPIHPDNRGTFTTASFGTDWAGYCCNWLTEYERTLDPQWLNKIKAGMDTQLSLAPTPGQLLGAGAYDPTTGKFMGRAERFFDAGAAPGAAAGQGARGGAPGSAPAQGRGRGGAPGGAFAGGDVGGATGFDLLFGTVEIMAEMELVVDHPKYWEAWHYYGAHTVGNPMAYAAYVTKNADLGHKAAETLVAAARHREIKQGEFGVNFDVKPHLVSGPDVPSPVWELPGRPEGGPDGRRLGTLIESLDWVGEYLPNELPQAAPVEKH